MIAGGIENKGFSLIEAIVQCPTAFGRKNKMAAPAQMMMWMRDNAVMKPAFDKLADDKKKANSQLVYYININLLIMTMPMIKLSK